MAKSRAPASPDSRGPGRRPGAAAAGKGDAASAPRLLAALREGQLELRYEPRIDLDTDRACAFEAVLSWTDPEAGTVRGSKLAALLAGCGAAAEADRWALARAIAQQRAWRARGLPPFLLALRVSGTQPDSPDFIDMVRDDAAACGSAPCLALEFDASTIAATGPRAAERLRRLRETGSRIGLGDATPKLVSEGVLDRLPADEMGIAPALVASMLRSEEDTTAVANLISAAHAAGIPVTAREVETEEQAELLRMLDCDRIQGPLVSAPLAESDAEALLRELQDAAGAQDMA